ncbi:hypothetical protein PN779_003968 [Enterobacter hormaechei]|nr:hypothetical protein [Enterobacter hormaechei]HAV1652659.1 hypothetical protein [Enterobacter hormaechei subsp. xiangfangensis]
MMSNDVQAKIAFVYTGELQPGMAVGDPTPGLTIACSEFPANSIIAVNFGVIGFNGVDNYSLDVKIYFNDEDVTSPSQSNKNLFKYRPQWSDEGEFVATMTIVESFTPKAPGIYRLEASLLFKEAKEEAVWELIDVKSSYFAVAKNWRGNSATQG